MMQRIINEGQTFSRRVTTDEDARARAAERALQARADRPQGRQRRGRRRGRGRRSRRRRADHLRQPPPRRRAGVEGPLPRPAPADHQADRQRLQADCAAAAAYWRGSEKNPQLQRVYGTAWPTKDDLKAYLDRLAEAEKRDHRKLGAELDLFSLPRRAGLGPGGLPPQGRRHQARDGGLRPPPAHRGGLPVRRHPAHLQGRAVLHLGAPAVLSPRACSRPWTFEGSRLPPQGDELPDAQPHLPVPAAAPTASCRCGCSSSASVYRFEKSGVVHGLTRVRGMTQDDSHSYVTVEGAGRRSSTCSNFVLSLLRDFGLDDYYLELSTQATTARTSSSAPTSSGTAATDVLERGRHASPASSSSPTRVAPRTTARRSRSRPATPSAAPGRCRPSSTTSTSPSGSGWSTRRPTAPPAAGDDPLGEVRLDRALHRRARRALRRGVPGVALAGAGRSASRSPRSYADYLRTC